MYTLILEASFRINIDLLFCYYIFNYRYIYSVSEVILYGKNIRFYFSVLESLILNI